MSEEPPIKYGGVVKNSEDIAKLYRELQAKAIIPNEREACVAFLLDSEHSVTGVHVISIGTMNFSPVHPREVFRPAIILPAKAIILAHNHPTDNCAPSESDKKITIRLRNSGDLLGIELLDHVIVGKTNHYSFSSSQGWS